MAGLLVYFGRQCYEMNSGQHQAGSGEARMLYSNRVVYCSSQLWVSVLKARKKRSLCCFMVDGPAAAATDCFEKAELQRTTSDLEKIYGQCCTRVVGYITAYQTLLTPTSLVCAL